MPYNCYIEGEIIHVSTDNIREDNENYCSNCNKLWALEINFTPFQELSCMYSATEYLDCIKLQGLWY